MSNECSDAAVYSSGCKHATPDAAGKERTAARGQASGSDARLRTGEERSKREEEEQAVEGGVD
jgi:hypothetical protein